VFEKLKEIHPDLGEIRITETEVDLVMSNGTVMGTREFVSDSETYRIMQDIFDAIVPNRKNL
jgi:hypothetical protein